MQLQVAGVWLSSLGAWGDLEWSTCLQGSDEVQWHMATTRQQSLRGRRSRNRRPLVTLYDSTRPVWAGVLGEPDDATGGFVATGLWKQAYNYTALTGAGARTSVPNTAVDAAINRGLPWTRLGSLSASVVSSDVLDEVASVGELLDAWADKAGKRWAVNASGEVYAYTAPTSPSWHLTPGVTLGTTDDSYASTLVGRRRTSTGGKDTEIVTDADAAARWGYREAWVDLTHLGYLTAGEANTILTAMLDKGIARLGYTNSVTVTSQQLLTAGGTPARLSQVRAGLKARVHGLWDDTRELNGRTTLDFLVGRTVHQADTVELQPVGLAPRNFTDVLASGSPKTGVAHAVPVGR